MAEMKSERRVFSGEVTAPFAPQQCVQRVRSRTRTFQSLLGPKVAVERVEHIVNGDRRCAYRIQHRGSRIFRLG
jgi:hypothetical protein